MPDRKITQKMKIFFAREESDVTLFKSDLEKFT